MKTEYRIKEYDSTETDRGVRSVVRLYIPQRKYNTFINRLLGGGWEDLVDYPCGNFDKAKQVIENYKLVDAVSKNRSIKYTNVE